MAIFKMNTESLSDASSSINKEASKVSDVAESIGGYDVSCEDDFDFAGAKAVLAANADACYNRVQNTAKLIQKCAEAHMDLQNQLAKMPDPEAEKKAAEEEAAESTNSGPSYSGPSYSGPSSSGRSHSSGRSGGSHSSGHSSSAVSGVSSSSTPTPVPTPISSQTEEDDIDDDLDQVVEENNTTSSGTTTEENTTNENNTQTDVTTDSSSDNNSSQTVHVTEAPTTVSEESSKVFMDDDFTYDSNGYAKLGNNYVISCNESVGKVGDQITITSSNGEKINCVIGNTTAASDSIDMIVDKNVYSPNNSTAMNFTNKPIINVSNEGQSSLLSSVNMGGVPTTNGLNDKDNLEDVIVVNAENANQSEGS